MKSKSYLTTILIGLLASGFGFFLWGILAHVQPVKLPPQARDDVNDEQTVQSASHLDQPRSLQENRTGTKEWRTQFEYWKAELMASVVFVNAPKIDKDGTVCVINPVYHYDNHELRVMVEDGIFYQSSFKGGRGALLIGRGAGRPPCPLVVGELFIENEKLKLSERLIIGSTKAAVSALLVDIGNHGRINKIGVAIGEKTSIPGEGYPSIAAVAENVVVTPQEIDSLSPVSMHPNWLALGYDGEPRDIGALVRVVWFEFQGDSALLTRIR